MSDLSGMTAHQAVMLLRAKCNELETWVKPRLGGPGTTDLDWLVADVALVMGITAEFIQRLDATVSLYEAHTENLIERVAALEGQPPASMDATGFLAEQRLREFDRREPSPQEIAAARKWRQENFPGIGDPDGS